MISLLLLGGDIFRTMFGGAALTGGLLLLGGLGVFAYVVYGKMVKGEGIKHVEEVAPEKAENSEEGVSEGGPDDEWDYY